MANDQVQPGNFLAFSHLDFICHSGFQLVRVRGKQMRKTPFIVICAFFLLCLIGMVTGEVKYVLEKAVSICLDCIGIG